MSDGVRVERCPKRIRAVAGGLTVIDSIAARYVWLDRPYPTYFFPPDDVHADYRHLADAEHDGLLAFRWAEMDHWFEEDEEVYTHPRDPYTRVDILASSRRVQVEVDGVTVADSTSPRLLFETGLPTRYYVPKTDVRMDLLRHTDTSTGCPYKGTAEYWSIDINGRAHPDIAWSYKAPFAESQKIAGLIAFYNEKVDLVVDGLRLDRPQTKFS